MGNPFTRGQRDVAFPKSGDADGGSRKAALRRAFGHGPRIRSKFRKAEIGTTPPFSFKREQIDGTMVNTNTWSIQVR